MAPNGVIEKRIPCGGCREEDSPIAIGKRDLSGREEGMKESWMSLVTGVARLRGAGSSSVCGANRKNGPPVCLVREFGGYVRVTLWSMYVV